MKLVTWTALGTVRHKRSLQLSGNRIDPGRIHISYAVITASCAANEGVNSPSATVRAYRPVARFVDAAKVGWIVQPITLTPWALRRPITFCSPAITSAAVAL